MLQMSYSTALEATAQAWVENCILAHGPPSSRMLNGYQLGENLFYSNSPYSWSQAIGAWHSEVEHYQYPNISTNGESIGHYTQVVWNTSYKVGCGVKNCNGTYLYGCHYYRAGNFLGWPPYKVGRPCGSCNNSCVNQLCTNPCPYVNPFSNCPAMVVNLGCNNTVARATCFASCSDNSKEEDGPHRGQTRHLKRKKRKTGVHAEEEPCDLTYIMCTRR
ncbi:cysteine-rich venom latisemin-like [Solea senegalensis]|uniref:Cysteine-rich venom latisemin-like n=1 Tax=Solea senegalensis TaxID=28829 RepID=A0AAV6PPM1_SOLSE|nr:cysteine-rich venom latisemin-like [Solea senegalensis]